MRDYHTLSPVIKLYWSRIITRTPRTTLCGQSLVGPLLRVPILGRNNRIMFAVFQWLPNKNSARDI